jgi:hypothetical protein
MILRNPGTDKREWHKCLQKIAFLMNDTECSATKQAPSQYVFGYTLHMQPEIKLAALQANEELESQLDRSIGSK